MKLAASKRMVNMSFRPKGWEKLTPDSYASLIRFLDRDREVAREKLQRIRAGLVRIFTYRGSSDPEDLAEETLDRLARKCEADEIAKPCVGDPLPFVYSFATRVFKESLRRWREQPLPDRLPAAETDLEDQEIKERMSRCLDRCLDKLDRLNKGSRELILEYYHSEKRAKIDHRRDLAKKHNWNLNQLRIATCRIRTKLRECVHGCLEGQEH